MLGDDVANALDAVGVTKQLVERWLGEECGCRERQDKINAMDAWARRVVSGRMESAREWLTRLMT